MLATITRADKEKSSDAAASSSGMTDLYIFLRIYLHNHIQLGSGTHGRILLKAKKQPMFSVKNERTMV